MIRWQYCLRFKLCNLKFTKTPDGLFLLDSLLMNNLGKTNKYRICLINPSSIVFYNEFLTDMESCLYFLGLNSLVEVRYSVGLADLFNVFSNYIQSDNFRNLFPYVIEALKKRDSQGIFECIDLCGEDLYWSYNKLAYLNFIYHRFCVDCCDSLDRDVEIDINKLAPQCLDSVGFSDSLFSTHLDKEDYCLKDTLKYNVFKNKLINNYEF